MPNGVVEVVQGGQIVRLNLYEPMVPGSTFTRRGIVYRVTGEGETAEPVGVAPGATLKVQPNVTILGWALVLAVGWFFLTRRR